MNLLPRTEMAFVSEALERSRVVALLGPRQCGKTTLAREFLRPEDPAYFDLENPADLARLDEPMTALAPLRGLVVIDEVQRRPELFPILRVLADRPGRPAKFLILGSAGHELLRQSSESLAGRIETVTMSGLRLCDLGKDGLSRHWLRGGFPPAYLARTENDSFTWRKQFVQIFLERDLPQFGIRIPSATLLRFWTILSHYHGQVWNASEAAQTMGVNHKTANAYLDLLESLLMVRRLQPWHVNTAKRLVKAPKIYFRDTGLLHALTGIRDERALLTHPRCGASWEGYVLEEILKATAPDEQAFWATHAGAEIDLILVKSGRKVGVEIKRTDAPSATPSMKAALAELGLEKIVVLHPGEKTVRLTADIEAVSVMELAKPDFSARIFDQKENLS